MRNCRPLALFALTAGLAILIGDVTVAADPPAKVNKLKKNKNKNKNKGQGKGAVPAAIEPTGNFVVAPPAPVQPIAVTPGSKDAAALAQRIDDLIAQKLAAAKVPSSPIASDEEFLRRVYLDLTGVIPSADKARAFLDSTDPNKRAKLIDELLESPHFGRRLADLWQAMLLPRDSGNRFVLREPFHKWLTEQFNANTPWNLFAFKLISAAGTVEDNPAVTFFLANRSVDKLTDSVSQHFLAIQLQCAQCHNHPFTEWKQTEYWGMAEFFSKVRADNPRNANKGGDNTQIGVQEGAGRARGKDFFPESEKRVPLKFFGGSEVKANGTDPFRPVLARWLTAPENPYFAKAMVNRTWALLFGTGFVNPIEDMQPGNPPSHPELLDALARDFSGSGFDLKFLYRAICTSQTYQRTSKPTAGNERDDHLFSHMTVKVMSPEQLFDSLTSVTGVPGAQARAGKAANGPKRNPNGARDAFTQFFLAGADTANSTEYEAGIPQALKLMNSRLTGNPAVLRQFVVPGDNRPAAVLERMYLVTLSRRPTSAEVTRLTEYVPKAATPVQAYSDILWAVLNSSEFTMVK